MESRRPLVADIKRNSLDDGPGIRSVVFFKGCPLKCVWCHNPECIDPAPEIIFRPEPCVGCRSCQKVCAAGAIDDRGPAAIDRDKCTRCGDCADECPSEALTMIGKYYEPGELAGLLSRDRAFYENSGGGVTLSGGEPTLALDYTAEVARKLKDQGIRVLLETCGDFDWDRFAQKLRPFIDRVFVDMKLEDLEAHQRFTGRDNQRIKQNLERLIADAGLQTLVRVPLVPEVTAEPANLEAIAAWLAARGVSRIALLPYNPLWLTKARGLGKDLKYGRDSWMSKEERERVKRTFAAFDLERDF